MDFKFYDPWLCTHVIATVLLEKEKDQSTQGCSQAFQKRGGLWAEGCAVLSRSDASQG